MRSRWLAALAAAGLAEAINEYPIVVLTKAPNKSAAQAFVDYVTGDKGQAVLTQAGFQAP